MVAALHRVANASDFEARIFGLRGAAAGDRVATPTGAILLAGLAEQAGVVSVTRIAHVDGIFTFAAAGITVARPVARIAFVFITGNGVTPNANAAFAGVGLGARISIIALHTV